MTAAYDLEDGEVFAGTPIVAVRDSLVRLTWADQASSGEFIPREALELEEDYGGFMISTDFLCCSDVHGDTNQGRRKMGSLGRGEAGARAEHAVGHLFYPPHHQPSPNTERRRAQALLDRMPVNAVLHQNTQVTELVRSSDASYPSTPTAGNRDIQKVAQPTAITSNANAPSSTVTNQKAYNLAGTPLTIAQSSEWGPHSTPSVLSASHETATSLTLPVIEYIHSGPYQLSPSNPIVANPAAYPSISMASNSSTHSAVFIGSKGAGPAVKVGVITGLHRVSQGTTATCSNAYQSGERAPQPVVISHISHNSPQVMQGLIPLINTKGAVRPVTCRSNEEVSHLAYIGVGPNVEDAKLASLDLTTAIHIGNTMTDIEQQNAQSEVQQINPLVAGSTSSGHSLEGPDILPPNFLRPPTDHIIIADNTQNQRLLSSPDDYNASSHIK
ncbi:hypothetical protein F0562_012033 [Nyssa sinensis]|uniref:Uncharacterized protein n=1 Tax=Nyssa sinensis TaxID=561372 RepID=A0A5J4ZUJ3_9ASTE|nr:hypothetical protein F0562_012033 [Nyssa sinensis]